MKLSKYQRNKDLESNGKWFDIEDGFKVKMRCCSSVEYQRELRKAKDKFDTNDITELDTDAQLKLNNALKKAFADGLIVDWQGLEDDNNVPVPYSKKVARDLVVNCLSELYDDLMSKVIKQEQFQKAEEEEAVKN